MTRPSRKDREDAITLLLCVADGPLFSVAAEALGVEPGSVADVLAVKSWFAVDTGNEDTDALEAAALIRDGWNIGDEVQP